MTLSIAETNSASICNYAIEFEFMAQINKIDF